jgi:hypothetical protein
MGFYELVAEYLPVGHELPPFGLTTKLSGGAMDNDGNHRLILPRPLKCLIRYGLFKGLFQ